MTGQLIGVDVGGTKVSVATIRDGRFSGPAVAPTASASTQALLDEIVASVERVREPDAAGVGVGVPSVIEFATGRVKSSVNLELEDIALRSVLEERLGLPVFVENDANCAALAEAYEGGELAVRNLVMFTVGTGVGGGLVLDGRLYRGATGGAAELGHTLIGLSLGDGAPPAGGFPQDGSLESLASGRALDALAEASFETEKTNPQWIYKGTRGAITIDLMFWLAGDVYCDDEMLQHATRERYGDANVNVAAAEDLIVIKLLAHDEQSSRHWHDALALLALNEIDWDYLLERGRRSPRRLLSLLVYAESVDLVVSDDAIRTLFATVYG
jgi:predicted NBD/HSP70 family sugar kinase